VEVRNNLTAAEYWEWRTTIADLEIAKEKLLKTSLEYKLLQRDAEILHVRQQLFLSKNVETAKGVHKNAQTEYERFKAYLEKELGQTLSNKLIDEITYEVRDLPDEINTQGVKDGSS
jgi:hypothetical protein